jgi:hypothetical protein
LRANPAKASDTGAVFPKASMRESEGVASEELMRGAMMISEWPRHFSDFNQYFP